MDHVREGVFLAEVVMYDRLVIPVPPDPEHTNTPEDRNFAEKQWDRWAAEYEKSKRDVAQRFINSGKTDLESVTAAVNAMAEHLDVL
jgi:hypothetical protein